jgi:uncharacterized protein YprB with RNaseH-like and TPR domain
MTTPHSLSPSIRSSLDRLRIKWQAQGLKPARQLPEPAPRPAPPEPDAPLAEHAIHSYPGDHRHGHATVASIASCDASPLGFTAPPTRWAFLDTETTGLAGGTGTYAFLIGVGVFQEGGFHIHQFFMRDFCEESTVLGALSKLLEPYEVLVTYNGKSYDAPLLETRYRMSRLPPPHEEMGHLDLLHAARRLWKVRLQSCRLVELESSVLGYTRMGDIPGELIPYRYFEYLRTGRTAGLAPVFHHNRLDILTLACLTSLVLAALGDPSRAPLHATDLVGLGGWLTKMGRAGAALEVYARALGAPLPAEVAARARWESAAIHKRNGDYERALPLWRELRTPEAAVEMAKYFEHRTRNYSAAMLAAQEAHDEKRIRRLERKAAGAGA